jgi:hypothetical protein
MNSTIACGYSCREHQQRMHVAKDGHSSRGSWWSSCGGGTPFTNCCYCCRSRRPLSSCCSRRRVTCCVHAGQPYHLNAFPCGEWHDGFHQRCRFALLNLLYGASYAMTGGECGATSTMAGLFLRHLFHGYYSFPGGSFHPRYSRFQLIEFVTAWRLC